MKSETVPDHDVAIPHNCRDGMLLRGEFLSRTDEIEHQLAQVTKSALGLFFFLTAFLILSDNLSLSSASTASVRQITLSVSNPVLVMKAFSIILWDLLLFTISLVALRLWPAKAKKFEALLALLLCLFLWKITFSALMAVITPDSTAAESIVPFQVMNTLIFVAVLAVWKEMIFQTLQKKDALLDSPLFEVFAWHHRKDAVFNLLFAVSVACSALGFPSGTIEYFLNFAKIFLLGSAAWGITQRCLIIISPICNRAPEQC